MVTEKQVRNTGVRNPNAEGGAVMCSITLKVQLKVRVMTMHKVVVGNW